MIASVRRLLLLSLGCVLVSAAWGFSPYLVDGDGDGVSDDIDDCPYSQPGTVVDAKGCPLHEQDGDGDGVRDEDDDCPYSAPGAVVDAKGCALDDDFDGVPNGIDRCPNTPLAAVVNDQGCAKGEQMQAPAGRRVAAPVRSTPLPRPPPAKSMPTISMLPPLLPTAPVPLPLAMTAAVTNPPPIVGATPIAMPAAPPSVPGAFGAEAPELKLSFSMNSTRLGQNDLALMHAYAKVFARRLAADPLAKLQVRGYAAATEKDAANLAAARVSLVRAALLDAGIGAERLQIDSGLMSGGGKRVSRTVAVMLTR